MNQKLFTSWGYCLFFSLSLIPDHLSSLFDLCTSGFPPEPAHISASSLPNYFFFVDRLIVFLVPKLYSVNDLDYFFVSVVVFGIGWPRTLILLIVFAIGYHQLNRLTFPTNAL